MNVGSGSTSESAERLKAILDNGSGYRGSVAGDGEGINGVPAWNSTLTEDRPTPMASPVPLPFGQQSETADSDRRIQANAIH